MAASKGPAFGNAAGARRANAAFGLKPLRNGGWQSSALAAAHPTYEVVNTAAAARVVVLLAQRIVMTSDRFGVERARLEVNAAEQGIIPVACSARVVMWYTQSTTSRTLALSASC